MPFLGPPGVRSAPCGGRLLLAHRVIDGKRSWDAFEREHRLATAWKSGNCLKATGPSDPSLPPAGVGVPKKDFIKKIGFYMKICGFI